MDRKVKVKLKNHHYDKPDHQRWLYKLSDLGMVKAILFIWGVCWVTIIISLGLVKLIIAWFKH